ncbi:MAG: 23S rRNA (guanosine(2251)-2'-O)-methyltransferase RlmB [Acidiferrobacterales bacterium]
MNDELAAGFHAVLSVLEYNPQSIDRLWVDNLRKDTRIAKVIADADRAGVEVQRVPKARLDTLAGDGVRHQGVLARLYAVALLGEADLFSILDSLQQPPLLLVLDGIQDPHNLGACLRSAAAAGVDAVIVPKDRSAPVNATTRRAASGATESIPIVEVTNISRVLRKLKQRRIWIYGASGNAESDLYQCKFTDAVAMVMGSEHKGLRHGTEQECDELVRIPVANAVDSLNVSVATGICLFEVQRQRQHQ